MKSRDKFRILTQKDKGEITMLIWFCCKDKEYFKWYRRFERFFNKWKGGEINV